MKYYCVKVDSKFYWGVMGEKGYLVDLNKCTIVSENGNYNRMLEEAKEYYPNSNVELKEVKIELV